MILKKGKNTIVFKPICKNKNGLMLGISIQREIDDNGLQVHTASKIHQPTKTRVQFLENASLIDASARAPKLEMKQMDTRK